MASLFQIGETLSAFLDLVDEAGGELTKEATNALESWYAEIADNQADKIDSYAALIRSVELRASARQAEIDRLAKHVKADENLKDRLKARLKEYLEFTKQPKVETRRFVVAIQKNGGLAPLDVSVPPAELATQFQRVKVEANTEAIRAALAKGEQIDGVVLQERGTHLRIR